MIMSMKDNNIKKSEKKESLIKLLKIVRKNNKDSDLEIKLNNIEKRMEKNSII